MGRERTVRIRLQRRLAGPSEPQRLVDDDAAQPRPEGGRAAELGEPPESMEIGALDGILRFGIVAQDASSDAEETPVVAPHDGAQGTGIVTRGARDKTGLVVNMVNFNRARRNGNLPESHRLCIGCTIRPEVPGRSAGALWLRPPTTRSLNLQAGKIHA